jgi:predicted Zn-dependent peptidase
MKITTINSHKFKTNLCSIFLAVPLIKENVTKNALIPCVLKRGTKDLPNQLEISKKLEEMYGASFSIGIDKQADFEVLRFYIEVLNDKFLNEKRALTKEALDLLIEVIFNPFVEENGFKKEYVDQEKDNLAKVIDSRKDDKAQYASSRMIEEMFKEEAFGVYKFGNKSDLESIDEKSLYDYYKELIHNAKINIFVNGDVESLDNLEEDIKEKLSKLGVNTEDNFKLENKPHSDPKEIKVINESMDIAQGKLIIGLNAHSKNTTNTVLYNLVLGGGANSKLFQNVREKSSLAYSAGSRYIKRKDLIMISTGIEIANYEKALAIIKKQIEEMKKGNITKQEFDSAKQLIISSVKLVSESARDTIDFYYDREMYGEDISVEKYIKDLENVTLEDVIEVAQGVTIDTIYFLKN